MMQNMRNLLFFITMISLSGVLAPAQNTVPLPRMSSKRLLNDLQITVASTPNLGDSMAIGLIVRYGSAYDPAEKGGLADLVSRMFMKATEDRTSKDIQDELAYLGASIEIQCDWDGFRFLLRGPSSKFERSLLLLYQVAAEAQFDEANFAAVRQSILQDLQKPPDPRKRIHAQLESALFSGTTYARPLQGTPASVSAITLGDVRYFYRRYFSPSQAALQIVGNVSASQVLQRASRIWGVWVRNEDIPFTFNSPRKPAGRRVLLEDDPTSPAAQFIMGSIFPRREDLGYGTALLVSRILQERLTKLLPTSLLTVGAEGRRLASPFYVQGQAAAEQAVDQIQKIQNAVEEMRNTPVSEDELAAARNSLIEEFNSALSSTDGLCGIMSDAELYHLGSNYAILFPEQIGRCDVETIKKAANDWIFPGGELVLIRGPLATLKSSLGLLGSYQILTP